MPRPTVSIGLPVYNGEGYVESAIESILNQGFDDFELIISDNASTDGTLAILQRCADADPRVKLHLSPTNLGAAWNFNRVLELSEGDYFKWAGHDDLLLPDYLEACLSALTTAPRDNILCYTKSYLIDESGVDRREYEDRMHLQDESPSERLGHFFRNSRLVNFIFGLWSTDALKATRGLGSYASADIVLIAELAMAGRFTEVPDRLFLRRRHEEASWMGTGKYEGFADWFDTSRRHVIVFPTWRITKELLKAVQLADVSPEERWRLRRVVLMEYSIRRKGALAREVLRVPGTLIGRLT